MSLSNRIPRNVLNNAFLSGNSKSRYSENFQSYSENMEANIFQRDYTCCK
jgi:hypothetical protein